jgi:hypothetical protein
MIVRVMEENQYRLDDAHKAEFDRLDQELLLAAHSQDQMAFQQKLTELLRFVREQGEGVPYTEVVPSDVVIPAEDMSLAEVQQLLDSDLPTP